MISTVASNAKGFGHEAMSKGLERDKTRHCLPAKTPDSPVKMLEP